MENHFFKFFFSRLNSIYSKRDTTSNNNEIKQENIQELIVSIQIRYYLQQNLTKFTTKFLISLYNESCPKSIWEILSYYRICYINVRYY